MRRKMKRIEDGESLHFIHTEGTYRRECMRMAVEGKMGEKDERKGKVRTVTKRTGKL